jgi:Ca-activated chloride channel family protein
VLVALVSALVIPQFTAYRSRSLEETPAVKVPAGRGMTDEAWRPPAQKLEMRAEAPRSDAERARKAAGAVATQEHPAPVPQEYVGRDRFEPSDPNPVKRTLEDPVSTFSVDVDTASYAFVRRALNAGHLPPKHAVRVEELVNYFDYRYPLPADRKVPFRAAVSVFPTPWNPQTQLLHIGIQGFDMAPEARPKANLVFLIDVSGSMGSPDKLPLLKNAFRMLVDKLQPGDTVAVVVYAGSAGTVLEPTPVREKGKILAALERLGAGGSTAGGEGIRRAYALAASGFDPEGVNRVILATDGDFNVGIRDPETLQHFVEREREKGIYLSVLGFGRGNYNDALMQRLAQNGNGNAAYIDTLNEARKVLVEEASSTLFPIAKDVKIQVEFNPARVAEYRLIGYESRRLRREDFNNDRVDAGDIGAGHSVTALYEITPVGSPARRIDDLRYGAENRRTAAAGAKAGEIAFLRIRYKLPEDRESRLIETPVTASDLHASLESASPDSRFAAAVAAFGQKLRGGAYLEDFTWDDILALAEAARGRDRFGYRTEFLNLVRLAETARAMGER